jgi:hypothetical protein
MINIYLVQRRTWFGEWSAYADPDCIDGSGVPVLAFSDRKSAEAHAARLEHTALSEASSLFRLVKDEVYDYRLGIDEDQFCEAIRNLGLAPPEPVKKRYGTERPWARWYDDLADTLTPGQKAGIAELFARLQVYEVVEVPLED